MLFDLYSEELTTPETSFYLIEITEENKNLIYHQYEWRPSLLDGVRIKKGDFFLYFRKNDNMYYIIGAGVIGEIVERESDYYTALIEKPFPLMNEVGVDLSKVTWHSYRQIYSDLYRVDRNHIVKMPFNFQLHDDVQGEIEMEQRINNGDFRLDDRYGERRIRIGHNIFARNVKINYGYRCAVTGICTREFLIASHIIPWSERQDIRGDSQNGICLSPLVDKAFEEGLITFDTEFKLVLSDEVQNDPILYSYLEQYQGRTLTLPISCPPNQIYLEWHRENKFIK
ncbi:HNH endonuclease [Ammoniphilus sp. 3BR4]|uniref:HNH endonuclease n=1 Tax=Ammoniphilus sp. 3BR4 TaxID=3158265 RepID=UPI003464F844